jgi:hypothetical protein
LHYPSPHDGWHDKWIVKERSKRTKERKKWGARKISVKTQDVNKCSGSEKGRMLFKSTDIFLLKKSEYNFAIVYSSQGEGSKNPDFGLTSPRFLINTNKSWLRNSNRGEKLEGGFHRYGGYEELEADAEAMENLTLRYGGYEELEAEAEAMENLTLLISSGLKSVLSWRTCRT